MENPPLPPKKTLFDKFNSFAHDYLTPKGVMTAVATLAGLGGAAMMTPQEAAAQVPHGEVSGQVREEGTEIGRPDLNVIFQYASPDTLLTDANGFFGPIVSAVGDTPRAKSTGISVKNNPLPSRELEVVLRVASQEKAQQAFSTDVFDAAGKAVTFPAGAGVYFAMVKNDQNEIIGVTKFTALKGLNRKSLDVVLADNYSSNQKTAMDVPVSIETLGGTVLADTLLTITKSGDLSNLALYVPQTPGGDFLNLQLINNDTGLGEQGEALVFDKSDGSLLAHLPTDSAGNTYLAVPADVDTFHVIARTFHPGGEKSYVRSKDIPSPGPQTLDEEVRMVATDDLASLPPDPLYPGDPATTNFYWLVFGITTPGAPNGEHIHSWKNGTYDTDTGNMILALIEDYNGNILNAAERAAADSLANDVWAEFGFDEKFGPLDVRSYSSHLDTDKPGQPGVPKDGFFSVRRDASIPNNANIGTESNLSSPYQMLNADAKINVGLGQSFDNAIKKEFASGLGARAPPTLSEPWASDVSWFSESTNLADFSLADGKIMKMLAQYEPTHIDNILGSQDVFDNAAATKSLQNQTRDFLRQSKKDIYKSVRK